MAKARSAHAFIAQCKREAYYDNSLTEGQRTLIYEFLREPGLETNLDKLISWYDWLSEGVLKSWPKLLRRGLVSPFVVLICLRFAMKTLWRRWTQ